MCHFQAQKGPFVLNKIFRYKPVLLLSSTCWPFSLCKIYKKFLQSIQSCEDASFLDPKWSICTKHFFGGKLLISFSSNYQPLSLFKISKKSFQRIQELSGCAILDKKLPICPNENFFRKPVNEPCSFHSCLSTCQKSKSDINLLVKY